MPGLPPLSDEQRRQALVKAAEARRARADVKEELKSESLDLSGLFDRADEDPSIARTKVVSVLEARPRVGKVKARRAMEEIGISKNRHLRGLGSRQRAALLARFG